MVYRNLKVYTVQLPFAEAMWASRSCGEALVRLIYKP